MATDSIRYLESYAWLGSKLGLDRITQLLERMENPQDDLKFIHLAGTNGKGSTAAFLAAIFRAAGYKTGLYTSPYIHSFHERMQVNGIAISDAQLDSIVTDMRLHADVMDDHPTTFELDTAVALQFFKEQNCDIVILETGMGGGLDATNVIKTPELCVITPIDMDHMEYLGDTIHKIAKAKAGILKKNCPVISAKQRPEALAVLQETANSLNAPFSQMDVSSIVPLEYSLYGQDFAFGEFEKLRISLLGNYQIENAALAVKAVQLINAQGNFQIPHTSIKQGLKHARWPGRFELCAEHPPIIVDGGHNAQGAMALAASIKRYFPNQKACFVVGVMADKDVKAILSPILPLAECFYTITPDNPRAMAAEKLAQLVIEMGGKAEPIAAGMQKAFEMAKAQAKQQGGIACYYGSLYSVGNARETLGLGAGTYYESK